MRPTFVDIYNRLLQRRLARTVWTFKNNYYKASSGRIVTQWLDGALMYGFLTKTLGRVSEVTNRSEYVPDPVYVSEPEHVPEPVG